MSGQAACLALPGRSLDTFMPSRPRLLRQAVRPFAPVVGVTAWPASRRSVDGRFGAWV